MKKMQQESLKGRDELNDRSLNALKNYDAFDLMSDEGLVELAQQGVEEAMSMVIGRFVSMVRKQALSFRRVKEDVDDLTQEGLIALLSAIHSYKPDSAASFRTFAFSCVRNRLISAIRKLAAQRVEVGSVEGLEVGEINSELLVGSAESPESVISQKDDIERLQNKLVKLLSPMEYEVLMWYSLSFTYEEISERLGITPKAVDNALQRIRRKISLEIFNFGT